MFAGIAAATPAQAEDMVTLNPLEWEASVDFDGTWRRADGQKTRDWDLEGGVLLRQRGYVLDPRIAGFSIQVEPRGTYGELDGTNRDETRDGSFLNYDISADALRGTPGPFSFDAHAGRSTETLEGSLGSRRDFDLQTRSAAVNWKTPIFPSMLRYSERDLAQTFESGLTTATSKRDEILRTLSYTGRSSKMDITLEQDWLDDQTDRDFDYSTSRARAGHRLGWGKRSRLTSRVDFFDRNGFNAIERLTVDETADIQHTSDLRSATSYRLTTMEQETSTIENAGAFSLTHDLYDNLTTTGHVSGSLRDSDVLDETEYETGLDLNYRKKILWGGRLNLGAGAAYRVNDRRSAGGFQSVVDESHAVPTAGTVLLRQRFVDESSIVVTDATGVQVFARGTDFTVAAAGGDLTEIFALPSGQIASSDTVLVSYSFEVLPSMEFSTVPYHYDASLDFGWIMVFHRASASDESLISGQGESFLVDREDSTTGIQLRWDRDATRATFSAQKRFQSSGSFETDSLDFTQSLVHSVSRRSTLNLSVSEVFTDSTNRSTDLYTADVSLRWLPRPNLSLRPHAGFWIREDRGSAVTEGERREYFALAGLDLQWFWRKLELSLRYERNKRGGDVADSAEHRLMFTLIRRSL